ncbi:MAG: ABC transporter permease [Acidimicrobiales bacterium]
MTLAAIVAQADPEPLIDWGWVFDHTDDIWEATIEHLRLTLIAVVVGFLISLPLAMIALRYRRSYGPLTWVTGILYTIPSIALFGFLIPITGLSTTTAEIALVSYTLLILLTNIVAGVDGVPASVKEAADGMGFTPRRRFVDVDLRLATPAMIAGLRIATVTTIGLVTVSALVGFGGYGSFIEQGRARGDFSTPIMLGAGLSVLLAAAADLTLVFAEWLITPWTHRRTAR